MYLRVLLIENAPVDARHIQEMLGKSEQYVVELMWVGTLSSGIEHLDRFPFDLVLLDLLQPDSKGLDTYVRLKRHSKDTPVVVLSGSADEELAQKALELGAQDYLIKDELTGRILIRSIRYATERRRAEQLLTESAASWQTTFDAIVDPICLLDMERRVCKTNKAFADLAGLAPEDVVGRNCCQLIHGSSVPIENCPMDLMIENGLRRSTTAQLGRRWMEIAVDPMTDPQGNLVGAVHILSDMTLQKRSMEALRESEELYRSLVHAFPDAVLLTDLQHRVTFASSRSAWLLEGSQAHVGFLDLIAPDDRSRAAFDMQQALERGIPRNAEYILTRADGSRHPVEISMALLRGAQGEPKGVVCVVKDLTERKKAESALHEVKEQLLQAQKMEAMGRLAGGVAHDFNNMLATIMGYAELRLRDVADGTPLYKDLMQISNTARRASRLTRQLLAFSRKQVLTPKILDLNMVVSETDAMLRRVIGEDIEVLTRLTRDLHPITADPGQMEQVLLNLAVNARDAMPDGGKLTIETANIELTEGYANAHLDMVPGPYVMLAVSDTGFGMDKEIQSSIFEPFFTTKEVGKGTGLGLSMVYGIVKQSGGNIWVYSEVGKGTTFKVYLPRAEKQEKTYIRKKMPSKKLWGTETVLVVEDDEELRDLVFRILASNGYDVLAAGNGNEALILCKQCGRTIDLVLTDVVMPGMSGQKLTKHLTELFPEIKVLFMSGYTETSVVHNCVLDEEELYLQKPFTPTTLTTKVRQVLDGTSE